MTKLCPFKKTGCPYASFWYMVTDHFISFFGGKPLDQLPDVSNWPSDAPFWP